MEKERKLKRKVLIPWLVTVMTADGRNKNSKSGKWSRKKTILWRTEHGLYTDKSSLNPPGGESRKQIHPICGKSGKYPYSWWNKRCLSVRDCVCRPRDMTPLLIQSWHFSHHQEEEFGERGQRSPGQCHSFLLECRALHNYATTSVYFSVYSVGGSLYNSKQKACTCLIMLTGLEQYLLWGRKIWHHILIWQVYLCRSLCGTGSYTYVCHCLFVCGCVCVNADLWVVVTVRGFFACFLICFYSYCFFAERTMDRNKINGRTRKLTNSNVCSSTCAVQTGHWEFFFSEA